MQISSSQPKFGFSPSQSKKGPSEQDQLVTELQRLGTSGTAVKYGISEEAVRIHGFSGTAAAILEGQYKLRTSA